MRRLLEQLATWLALAACVVFLLPLRGRLAEAPPTPPSPALVADLWVEVVAAGSAASNVELRAFRERSDRAYDAVAPRRTDAQGRARFLLPPGAYWLVARAEGAARWAGSAVARPGVGRLRIELERGHALQVSALRDDDGRPIGGATVLVEEPETNTPPFAAVTRADGTATLDGLGAGPWRVTVAAPGYGPVTREDVEATLAVRLRPLATLVARVVDAHRAPIAAEVELVGAGLWPSRRASTDARGVLRVAGLTPGTLDLRATAGTSVAERLGVALAEGVDTEVELRLEAGRVVVAHVVDGADHSRGVADADVLLSESGLGPFPQRARTDATGTVRFAPVPVGPLTVSARADGFVARVAQPVPDDGTEVELQLLRAGRVEVEVVDTRGLPVDGATLEIAGTDPRGLPITDSPELEAFQRLHFEWALPGAARLIPAGELGVMPGPIPPIPPPGASTFAVGRWVSGADGRCTLTPVTPGSLRVYARHPELLMGSSALFPLEPDGTAKVRLTLAEGFRLEGRVLDERELPVAGARVELGAEGGVLELATTTREDGSFAFSAVPARLTVTVSRAEEPAQIALRRSFTLEAGRVNRVELTLTAPRETTTVIVVDEAGRPLDNAHVRAESLALEQPLRRTRYTGTDGRVVLEALRGLPVRLIVDAPGRAPLEQDLDAAPERVELKVPRAAKLEGSVRGPRGAIAGATVSATRGGWVQRVLTNADGAFTFDALAPGALHLELRAAKHVTRALELELNADALDRPTQLEPIELSAGLELRGVVVDEQGRPVGDARVALTPLGLLPAGATPELRSAPDGTFLLEDAPDRAVTVYARKAAVGSGEVAVAPKGARFEDVRVVLQGAQANSLAPRTGSLALTLRWSNGVAEVAEVAASSQAEAGGVRRGDVIATVDGVRPSALDEVERLLTGPLGSDVLLGLRRGSASVVLRRIAREPVGH